MKTKKSKVKKTVVVKCERCGRETTHSLMDAETRTYRCNICGTYIVKKK